MARFSNCCVLFFALAVSALAIKSAFGEKKYVTAPAYMSLGDLMKQCVVEGSNYDKQLCMGYVTGVVDMLQDERRICIPLRKDYDAEYVVSIVIRYLEHTSDPLDLTAASAVSDELERLFKCN